MSVAVLPFNAGEETTPGLARQLANFAAEIVRSRTGADVHAVNYLARVDEKEPARLVHVNPSTELNEAELLGQLFEQTDATKAMDGLLKQEGDSFKLVARVFEKGNNTPLASGEYEFTYETILPAMRGVIDVLCKGNDLALPDETKDDLELFGTNDGTAFAKFLDGYDALQYIEKTQGQVIEQYNPAYSFDVLNEAIALDKDWEAPQTVLLQMARICTQMRLGNADILENALAKMQETLPEDDRPLIVLGELYQGVGEPNKAIEVIEKAIALNPEESALYTRLGIAQQSLEMMANAEQNFRKAVEMEGPDKPTMGFLAQVLQLTERMHEVPPLWKSVVDASPANGHAWANYAASLFQAGSQAEGLRAFDEGMEKAEEPIVVKRLYAPALASVGEHDRAMDMYEDCIDVAPNDIQLLLEYAQTLQAADRSFEIPKILRDVLGSNPDPNTRAQTLAWLVELEQPKRVESVQQAKDKLDANEFEAAIKILRPMRNWLADYWKMWALYAAALNRTGDHREAEEASKKLIELFPGNEIGFAELANALGPQGKHEEQYNAMRYGYSIIPNNLPILLNLGLAAKRLGRAEEAQHIAAQIRGAVGDNPELEPVLKDIETPMA